MYQDEITKWQLTFTEDFYKELFRLWGLPYNTDSIRNKPQFIGKLTSKYIYEQLPIGVFEKIKDKTPKNSAGGYRYRLHQSLTPEIGREHLKKQLSEVIALMSVSNSESQFNALFERRFGLLDSQLELELDESCF